MTEENEVSKQLSDLGLTIHDSPNSEKEQQIRDENRLAFLQILPLTQEFVYCHGPLTIYIKDFRPQGGAYYCNIKFVYKDVDLGYFKVDLVSNRGVMSLARQVVQTWPDLPIEYPTLKQDIHQLQDFLRLQLTDQLSKGKPSETYIISVEEEEAALELLRDPLLFSKLDEMMELLGIVQEFENRMAIYLAYTSRLLVGNAKPIHILIKGESSSGKSFVPQLLLNMFPPTEYIKLADATPQSFYYLPETDLTHKIVLIHERPGSTKADYAIRILQSEDDLTIQVTVKNPQTGDFETHVKKVKGPMMFLTTTTSPQINQENETRNLMLFSDDSPDQTRRIFKQIATSRNQVSALDISDQIQLWRNVQSMLKPFSVEIPHEISDRMAETFPNVSPRTRRDFARYMDLIATITLLHQYQREKVDRDGVTKLIATRDDYCYATLLVGNAISRSITTLPLKTREIVEYVRSHLVEFQTKNMGTDGDIFDDDAEQYDWFTWKHVYEGMNWDRITTLRWGKPAIESGIFELIEGGRKGRGHSEKFRYNGSRDLVYSLSPIPEFFENWKPGPRIFEWSKRVNTSTVPDWWNDNV